MTDPTKRELESRLEALEASADRGDEETIGLAAAIKRVVKQQEADE